jgi:hypothetical protein
MHNLSAKRGRPVVLALGAFLITVAAVGASTHGGDSLGVIHFPVACSPTVQAKFDRAVALLHNFVFPDTVRAFTAIIQEDPTCAMGYWGLAMSQRGNPLIPPFDPAALKRGWDAVQQGVATKPQSAREREYLAAVEAQYRDFDKVDQQTRSRAYADAMGRLHEHYPDDSEAAIFYALALNEAADLGDGAFTNQLKAVAILQMEAKRQPDHRASPII